jgi:hypothetical protein
MTDEPKATPRPWTVGWRNRPGTIVDANGEVVWEMSVDLAKEIVQSVNDRADLLAKVERYEKALKSVKDKCDSIPSEESALEQ